MQIQLLTVTPKSKPAKTPGKTYMVLELAYKNLTFQGKVEGRDLMSFGANKPAHDVLAAGAPGDVFEIEVVKNAAGYNDWVSAKKSDTGATASVRLLRHSQRPGDYQLPPLRLSPPMKRRKSVPKNKSISFDKAISVLLLTSLLLVLKPLRSLMKSWR